MGTTNCERNSWIDVIKFIASFFVVCIHIPLADGAINVAVNTIARFAVPTFFAISVFYVLQADTATVKRRLLKTLQLYLIASAIYHARFIISRFIKQGITGIVNYFIDVFLNVENIKNFFIFNIPFSSLHLWYLLAMIYVYLIWLLIIKFSLNDKIIMLIGAITLLVNLVCGELLSVFDIFLDCVLIRNFAFTGLPFFILGYLLRKYNHLFEKIKPIHLILAIAIGNFEELLSRLLIGHNEVYIGSVLCCFSIILLAEKLKTIKVSDKFLVIFRSSTDIYIFHVLFSGFLLSFASLLPPVFFSVIKASMPFWAFAACIVFSLLKSLIFKKLFPKPKTTD
jgi:surface polysaccharide O-acyltransferase-like enzyme